MDKIRRLCKPCPESRSGKKFRWKAMKTLARIFKEYSDLPGYLGIGLHSVNQLDRFDDSPLQIAVCRHDREEVECLLRPGRT